MDFLSVDKGLVVNGAGKEIRLRGTCPGGWMNMEDFINGHPGAEHTLRATMADELGSAKATFFFERLLDHFFNEDDVAFLKKLGATVVRLPLNYRHFEDDRAPFKYKDAGFERLSRVLRWCEKHGLYVILDLHAAQGWQNVHWHSDNASRISLFWESPHYQDRFIGLWQELARRYKDEPVVAGYNLLNEPCASKTNRGDFPWKIYSNYKPGWDALNALYRRAVSEIRKIDQRHIIFLEGDNYSRLFSGLDEPFAENLVYSSHNYTASGFGPGAYPGEIRSRSAAEAGSEHWDKAKQERVFLAHEGTVFTQKHQVPLWVGEFGSAYNGPREEIPDRLRAMDDQIGIFERYGAHWTNWNYKDVGVMGIVTLDPASPYMERIGDLLRKKQALGTDDWMPWLPPTPVKEATAQLADMIRHEVGDERLDEKYTRRCVSQTMLCFFTGGLMQPYYASFFKGLSENEIDDLLASFSFSRCRPNEKLIGILGKYMNQKV